MRIGIWAGRPPTTPRRDRRSAYRAITPRASTSGSITLCRCRSSRRSTTSAARCSSVSSIATCASTSVWVRWTFPRPIPPTSSDEQRFPDSLMLGPQEVEDGLHRAEGRHRNLDEDREPPRHRAVPQARTLEGEELAPLVRLPRHDDRPRVDERAKVEGGAPRVE